MSRVPTAKAHRVRELLPHLGSHRSGRWQVIDEPLPLCRSRPSIAEDPNRVGANADSTERANASSACVDMLPELELEPRRLWAWKFQIFGIGSLQADREWEEVEPEIQRRWETEPDNRAWNDVKNAAIYGWRSARNTHQPAID